MNNADATHAYPDELDTFDFTPDPDFLLDGLMNGMDALREAQREQDARQEEKDAVLWGMAAHPSAQDAISRLDVAVAHTAETRTAVLETLDKLLLARLPALLAKLAA